MNVGSAVNIQNRASGMAEGLERGDRVYLRVTGGLAGAFYFDGFHGELGINISTGSIVGRLIRPPVAWGDIIELRPMDEKPDPFHSDIPEVAEVLTRIKAAVQMCVRDSNTAGVKYLMDQVLKAKRAEIFFQGSLRGSGWYQNLIWLRVLSRALRGLFF